MDPEAGKKRTDHFLGEKHQRWVVFSGGNFTNPNGREFRNFLKISLNSMVVFIMMQCLGWYHVVTPEQNEPPQPEIAGGTINNYGIYMSSDQLNLVTCCI